MVQKTALRQQSVGLRERKKADTREKILNCASDLFARNGYPSTSMEAIAADVDISATTLYNYFGTKGQILLAMIARSDAELIEREVVPEMTSKGEGIDHLVGFLDRLTGHSLTRIDRGTWRYAIAHTLVSEDNEDIKDEYIRINEALKKHLVEMLQNLGDRGVLKGQCEIGELGEMIFDMFRVLFIRLISSDDFGPKQYQSSLRRYVSAAIGAES
ncbi:TetR/AcrR family transcriptional regulator [Agrobacterium tumefaciens]|uniref:TetR family transcriptional regulator n=1 Tax=Agrobacterium tumefaciens TaxID=358 RepID=UPI001571F15D|nr:TetR/AcrR family transcriptional regulator [Agrobacterium tumefaciens]